MSVSTEMKDRRKSGIGSIDSAFAKADARNDGRVELKEEDAWEATGFAFPTWKKWMILSVIFAVQVSMNFNSSVYPFAEKMEEEFNIAPQTFRVGQMIFLVFYAFGCELWAPWSEEFGRWPVLQCSLFLVNIWQIPCGIAKNFNTIIAMRALGGLSSAGGSVTLGMVADMWDPDAQQYAVAFIVLSSVGGTTVGPFVGGFLEQFLDWRWNFWVQLIFGGAVQLLHFFLVPETRVTILLDREAKKRRKRGIAEVYGPNELKNPRISMSEVLPIWKRPFEMFLREPIVLCLSLLSGFSDALIFTFLEAFTPVYKQWGFNSMDMGLAFLPIIIGYLIAYVSFFPSIHSQRQKRRKEPDCLQPEARLWWLLWTAPLEFIGLFGFAWTSFGPPTVHWIAPMIFSCMIAIANYSIYMATIDYMIASYGPYAASATGGNGFSRDFLAGIAAMYSSPFYEHFPKPYTLEYPTTILACIAFVVTIPIFVFYWKGPKIRERSKFAQVLAADRKRKMSSNPDAMQPPEDIEKDGMSPGEESAEKVEM